MKDLDLSKFNPTISELQTLSTKYQGLEIKGIEDKKGYSIVGEARKELKRKRVDIEKQGKAFRAEAVEFQKQVITIKDELVGIIEPLELELKEKQDVIDEEKEKIKRRELLPERREQLTKIGVKVQDEFLLLMDNQKFAEYLVEKRNEYLEEKERKQKEEQDKIDKAKRKLEEDQRIEDAKKKEREEAEKRAVEEKKRMEDEKRQAIEDERIKAKEERDKLIRDQKAKEDNDKRIEKEKQEKAEKEKQELEKKKKYIEFLKKHNYKKGEDFYELRDGNRMILYKKVGEFNINK